nr:gliding motility-associated C-terminal domain-containing protein [Chitinophagales bacterium]
FVYTWQDGSSGNTYLITESGEYWVDVNSNGCITRAYIDVIDDPCICEMIVPNAFSPNNDGYNDEFRQLECSQLNRFNMKIYNRWGELMFETSDYSAGWDGTFRGEQCEMGAYVFVIEYDIIDGESGIKQGSFLLLR